LIYRIIREARGRILSARLVGIQLGMDMIWRRMFIWNIIDGGGKVVETWDMGILGEDVFIGGLV
jgi:hypothetical protein